MAIKVRILTEQQEHHQQPDRRYLASGEEVELPDAWAKDLLNGGQAEVIASKPSSRAEKRPGKPTAETR